MIAGEHPYFAGSRGAADHEAPLALAHRGGSLYGPNVGLENTLLAFRNAVALGYTHLETDVHLTSDDVLVAAHDDRLDRVSDKAGAIADLTWHEVGRARIGSATSPTPQPIPTMAALLEAFPEARFNIDLKAPGAALALWRLIGSADAFDRVCVGSFTNRTLWRFRRLARGRVATSAGRLGTAALRLLPFAVSRRIHTPALAFQVPVRYDIGPIRLELVTQRFVERAHRLGRHVHVWTIDEESEMERLLDLGVDGIVTDNLEGLLAVLARRRAAGRDG